MRAANQIPVTPRLMTAAQAARYLGCESTAVLANIPIKPVKLAERGSGCQPKFDRAALDAWLDRLSGLSLAMARDDDAGGSLAQAAFADWRAKRATGGY